MLTDREIIQRLYDTGHFWSPRALAVTKVKAADLDTLALYDPVVVAAAASYQEFMQADLEPLVFRHHRRMLIVDGGIGPATRDMMEMPRCAHPDHPDPDKATGSGSWPAGCHGKPGIHEITISFDTSNMPAAVKPWLAEIKARLTAELAAVGVLLTEVALGQAANIRMSWRVLAGSTIGLAEFNSETCGDSVFCYLDPGYAPDLVMVLILLMHEVGHCLNLEHSGADSQGNVFIMHPSIRRVPPHWVKRDSTGKITYQDIRYAKLKEHFGGEPLDPVTPVPPTIPPTPGDDLYGSTITLSRPGKPDATYVKALDV